ncbi:hypothetical protein [Nocardia thailandica]
MKLTTFRMTLAAVAALSAAALLTGCGHSDRAGQPFQPPAEDPSTTSFVTPTATTSRVPATPPSTPVAAPSTLPAELGAVAMTDPNAVATAAARIWFSWDTTTDTSPYDAKLRTVPLLDPTVALQLRMYPPVAGPGAEWLALTADSSVLTVGPDGVRPGVEAGAPADTEVSASRLLEVTQTVRTPSGPRPDRHVVAAIVLRRVDDGWRVVQVATR